MAKSALSDSSGLVCVSRSRVPRGGGVWHNSPRRPRPARQARTKPARRPANRARPQGRSASRRAARPAMVAAAPWARVAPRAHRAPRRGTRRRGRSRCAMHQSARAGRLLGYRRLDRIFALSGIGDAALGDEAPEDFFQDLLKVHLPLRSPRSSSLIPGSSLSRLKLRNASKVVADRSAT